jgi:lipopolysaccharide transport system ATP-binding protein
MLDSTGTMTPSGDQPAARERLRAKPWAGLILIRRGEGDTPVGEMVVRAEGLSKRYLLRHDRSLYKQLRKRVGAFVRQGWSQGAGLGSARDAIWAIRNVSFEVEKGEKVGVIGRNGAGKSTLLKVLTRIAKPTSGWAEIHGRVGSLLEVGTGFHPELSGRQNIYLNGAILGMRRGEIDKRLDEMVAFAEIERFLDTPVKHYSSGMYARLAFAVAAHLETDVLLVDEVLAVGDAALQRKCFGKMDDLVSEGRTVLFVSHNMSAITRLCPRALLLEEGQLIVDGPSKDVVASYLDRSGGSARREWCLDDAPGSERVKLLSVVVESEDGRTLSVASVDEPLRLRLTYRVLEPNSCFRCAAIFSTEGVLAFASVEPTESNRERTGIYHSVVEVPPNLLAEGEYSVGVSIFTSRGVKDHHLQYPSAVIFQVTDHIEGTSARGDYRERLRGVVRPLLSWKINFHG